MSEQLSFDLSARPALGRDVFFVSDANAVALAMIDGWRDWPMGKLLLTGPHGSGKTHLAHVWANDTGARLIDADALLSEDLTALAAQPLCVEDIDQIAGHRACETALFHLHNLAHSASVPLMLTAAGRPSEWGLVLPDLLSRVQATPLTRIEPPDETLLGALFAKLFSDRQLSPSPGVLAYLARHAPRSFDVAGQVVAALDAEGLRSGRRLTRDTARLILDQYT